MSIPESAKNLQCVLDQLQRTPWHTGYTIQKGSIVKEPLDPYAVKKDSIKRYTDQYLQERTIGLTSDTYKFHKEFLPNELLKSIGLQGTVVKQAKQNLNIEIKEEEDKGNNNDEENEDEPGEEGEIEQEDEFEELEDDDYNAEKYFDDGDDYGADDDGDNEAAY